MKVEKVIQIPKDPELKSYGDEEGCHEEDEDNFPSNQNGAYKLKSILKNPADGLPYPSDKVQCPNNDQNPYLTTDLPSSDTKDQHSYPTTDFPMKNFNVGESDERTEATLTSPGFDMGMIGGWKIIHF